MPWTPPRQLQSRVFLLTHWSLHGHSLVFVLCIGSFQLKGKPVRGGRLISPAVG
jgi:hypothetical protein